MDVFREGYFKLLALMEIKLKGDKEVSWCVVNGIIADVQEMERAREGMAILLNDVWHSVMIDFGCGRFRILWIKLKFVWGRGYSPSERDDEERDRFCNDMDRIVDRVKNGYILCILGDING